MPGFTHLQTAQPVLVSHWIMAYFWMLKRDYERLQGYIDRLCECPLGAAALAGTDFPIDRGQPRNSWVLRNPPKIVLIQWPIVTIALNWLPSQR